MAPYLPGGGASSFRTSWPPPIPHRTRAGIEEDVAWPLHRAASYLQTRGEPTPARPLFDRARNLRCSTLGEDHPDTLRLAHSIAATSREVGQ